MKKTSDMSPIFSYIQEKGYEMDKILFRLVSNGKVLCERYSIDEVQKIKDNLPESERLTANIITITESGNQFLLG